MGRFVFTGRVLPERAAFNYDQPFAIDEVQTPDVGLKFRVEFQIRRGQVIALVDAEDSTDVLSIRNYLDLVIRRLVDSATYLWGSTFDLELTSVLKPGGEFIIFDGNLVGLQAGETPLSQPEIRRVLMTYGKTSAHAAQALGDLREAIRSHHDTGFFAYRGIEAIRESFAVPSDKGRSQSFDRLRNALRVSRSYIDWVGDFRKTQAHATPQFMTGDERFQAVHRLWRIFHRFCVYVLRGSSPLPEGDFELLI